MRPGLKIAHKGLVLISLTLVVELALLAVLAYLLIQADNAIKREVHSKKIIYSASNVARFTIESGTSLAIYKFTRVTTFRDRSRAAIAEAFEDAEVLEKLVQGDPLQVVRMEKCMKVMREGRKRMEMLLKKLDKEDDIKSVFLEGGLRLERKLIDGISADLSGIVESERNAAKLYSDQEHAARQAVIVALAAAFGLNVLLAIGGSLFFFHDIAKRIQVVIDNTRRMPKKLAFNPPIAGSDEIAELDSAFHNTARELQESEEMKRMLIGMVSHDLRSPLTSVNAALEMLNEGVLGELSPSARETVSQAWQDVGRLLKLTDDLLDAEKLASGNIDLRRRKVSASDLVEDVIETMESVAKQYEVNVAKTGDDFEVYADADRMSQVLVNLVGNAIKHSPTGETVLIAFSRDEVNAEFRVADRGPGIASEHLEIIFEKFTQLNNGGETNIGKGLGLAICKSLAELHGGTVGVDSELGQGSTFWVRIPCNQLVD